jgi:hypothetical protein
MKEASVLVMEVLNTPVSQFVSLLGLLVTVERMLLHRTAEQSRATQLNRYRNPLLGISKIHPVTKHNNVFRHLSVHALRQFPMQDSPIYDFSVKCASISEAETSFKTRLAKWWTSVERS